MLTEEYPLLFLQEVDSLEFGKPGALVPKIPPTLLPFSAPAQILAKRMLGGKREERNSEYRIWTCCETGNFRTGFLDLEFDLCSSRTAYPVPLHGLDVFREFDFVQ